MSISDVFRNSLSRRKFLKGVSAVMATAATTGCSTDSDRETDLYDEYLVHQNDLNYNSGTEIKFSTGPYNCGARCVHKYHIKNGRVLRMTSDGDIPRQNSTEADECPGHTFGELAQRRACVRGYGYIQHNYQPNRLKYPLYQTRSKGDLEGFKRVSWEWAVDKIATEIKKAADNRGLYGYIPMVDSEESLIASIVPDNNFILSRFSNESTGNVECARLDTVGMNAFGNAKNDRFNTKFLICWAQDPSRTTYWQIKALWIHTKLKEANIPLVFISSTFSDSAALTGTGVSVQRYAKPNGGTYNYTYKNETSPVHVPRWIACRPTTDGALTVAMMYVLYKNELYDLDYLKENTFGFFPGTGHPMAAHYKNITNTNNYPVVTRLPYGPNTLPLVFPADVDHSEAVTGSHSRGDRLGNNVEYKVPRHYSFVEYLDALDGTLDNPLYPRWGDSYDEVLEYAAALTGVKPEYIEALAMKYAEPSLLPAGDPGHGAAMIDIGGGAQRAYNGAEWVWLQICLTAMCGYTDKEGGSSGINYMSGIEEFVFGAGGAANNGASMPPVYGRISFCGVNSLHIPVDGTDGRTREQVVADIKLQTSGKDGSEPALDVTVFPYYQQTGKPLNFEVFGSSRNLLNNSSNINKNILGMKAVFSYGIDNMMTATTAHCDVVLPQTTHFEDGASGGNNYNYDPSYFLKDHLCNPLYEAKSTAEFKGMLQAKILEKFGLGDGTYTPPALATLEDVKSSYDTMNFNDIWRLKYPSYPKPDWEEVAAKGRVSFISPKDNPLIGFRDAPIIDPDTSQVVPGEYQVPGKLYNSTGLINFFSPFWYIRMDSSINGGKRGAEIERTGGPSGDYYGPGWRTATARYIPVPGGYEDMFTGNDPLRGTFVGHPSKIPGRKNYTMLYMTNKSRNRAHTVFDSTAMVKDQFRQTAKINPATAAERGIKEGDLVYVYNDRCCMKIPAELTHQILPGYVSIEHGAWYRAHPTETATVIMTNRLTTPPTYTTKTMRVDVGGADNLLTDEGFTLDVPFSRQTLAAQTGACEVSLTKPD